MKTSLKVTLGLLILVAVIGFLATRPRPEPADRGGQNAPGKPSFEFYVIKPRLARPLFGILPTVLEEKLEPGGELRFDHTNSNAKVGRVTSNRLELSASEWLLLVETNALGKITAPTQLSYSMRLAEKQRNLLCRPLEESYGYLHTTRPTTSTIDGNFLIELSTCENVETGKVIKWPPAALTVRGTFRGLPYDRDETRSPD